MRSRLRRHLFWRIYLTLLASLALVVGVGAGLAWLVDERGTHRWDGAAAALAVVLPPPGAHAEHRALASRLAEATGGRVVFTMADGTRIEAGSAVRHRRGWHAELADGRQVSVRLPGHGFPPLLGVFPVLAGIAIAVALAAHPVVRRLTRRLEALREGVAEWGEGRLSRRLPDDGRDEVAALARSFNAAAARVEALLAAHKTLLANASHELRSPLARLRLAIELRREAEIERSFAELDTLIEEILLASRLDHAQPPPRRESVDLLALAAEETARAGIALDGAPTTIEGDPVLLRRLLRNLIDNALRHGAPPVEVEIGRRPGGDARIAVHDRGPGIAESDRARVFEPFHRPAGTAESSGSWGLGLSLVRQIAARHGGTARCEPRPGGGASFVVTLAAG